jgi:hypothetical protein
MGGIASLVDSHPPLEPPDARSVPRPLRLALSFPDPSMLRSPANPLLSLGGAGAGREWLEVDRMEMLRAGRGLGKVGV